MDDVRAKGKKAALLQMRKMAMDSMKDGLGGMMGGKDGGADLKKVTVASPDQAGLEHGLDKAKQLIHGHDMGGDDAGSMPEGDEEQADDAEHIADAHPFAGNEDADEEQAEQELGEIADKMSSEELDKMIQMLTKKKAMKQAQSGSDDASEEADMSDTMQ